MICKFFGIFPNIFPRRSFLLFFLFCLFFHPLSAQENRLIGRWVLDFVTDANKMISDIHSPLFSNETIYEISKDQLKINDQEFKARYDDLRNIDMVHRTLFYSFESDYLVVKERGDPDHVFYFLKDSIFIKTYPEFQAKYVERNGEKLLIEDTFNKVKFTSNMGFASSMQFYSSELKKKSRSEFFCEVEFVLDTNNVIRDVVFLNPVDLKLEADLRKALNKISGFFFNNLKENVLVVQRIQYSTFDKKDVGQEIKDAISSFQQGDKLYHEGKYEEALAHLEKAIQVPVNRKQFFYYNDCLRTLGICYLMLNRGEDACKVFNDWGDSSNFNVRNYLRFFCTNKVVIRPPDKETMIENIER